MAARELGKTTKSPLRVAIVELPARWDAVDEQLELARATVGAGEADLVLLPEASFTGYVSPDLSFELGPFAEPLERGTARLASLAAAYGCDVVGPVIEKDGGACFNALVGVGPDGHRWLHYRKRHPWYPERWATPGPDAHPLVAWRGLNLTAAICFDVHFLAEEAADVLSAADVLLFPSAWVDGGESRQPLLSELAVRFAVSIVNANWGQGRPRIAGQGGSLVAWPDGTVTVGTGARLEVELRRPGALSARTD